MEEEENDDGEDDQHDENNYDQQEEVADNESATNQRFANHHAPFQQQQHRNQAHAAQAQRSKKQDLIAQMYNDAADRIIENASEESKNTSVEQDQLRKSQIAMLQSSASHKKSAMRESFASNGEYSAHGAQSPAQARVAAAAAADESAAASGGARGNARVERSRSPNRQNANNHNHNQHHNHNNHNYNHNHKNHINNNSHQQHDKEVSQLDLIQSTVSLVQSRLPVSNNNNQHTNLHLATANGGKSAYSTSKNSQKATSRDATGNGPLSSGRGATGSQSPKGHMLVGNHHTLTLTRFRSNPSNISLSFYSPSRANSNKTATSTHKKTVHESSTTSYINNNNNNSSQHHEVVTLVGKKRQAPNSAKKHSQYEKSGSSSSSAKLATNTSAMYSHHVVADLLHARGTVNGSDHRTPSRVQSPARSGPSGGSGTKGGVQHNQQQQQQQNSRGTSPSSSQHASKQSHGQDPETPTLTRPDSHKNLDGAKSSGAPSLTNFYPKGGPVSAANTSHHQSSSSSVHYGATSYKQLHMRKSRAVLNLEDATDFDVIASRNHHHQHHHHQHHHHHHHHHHHQSTAHHSLEQHSAAGSSSSVTGSGRNVASSGTENKSNKLQQNSFANRINIVSGDAFAAIADSKHVRSTRNADRTPPNLDGILLMNEVYKGFKSVRNETSNSSASVNVSQSKTKPASGRVSSPNQAGNSQQKQYQQQLQQQQQQQNQQIQQQQQVQLQQQSQKNASQQAQPPTGGQNHTGIKPSGKNSGSSRVNEQLNKIVRANSGSNTSAQAIAKPPTPAQLNQQHQNAPKGNGKASQKPSTPVMTNSIKLQRFKRHEDVQLNFQQLAPEQIAITNQHHQHSAFNSQQKGNTPRLEGGSDSRGKGGVGADSKAQ